MSLYIQHIQEWLFSLVRQGINATSTHTLDGVEYRFHRIVSFLLDLDLWGLGQTPARFANDTEAIWKEYQSRYTREEFDLGRSGWAAAFLKRKCIYYTEKFRVYEEDARNNLAALAGK